MKITPYLNSDPTIENTSEVLIETANKKYILRERVDNILVLVVPKSEIGNVDRPVRRLYFEPIRDGLLIMQWVPAEDGDGKSS